ncbi:peptidoglycan/xylan/chitin deacetylase (PgdA/CDA1 family) [Desulfitispora alkaliphila]|uniref:polysaccharide deacetylase family protein n=1 Tax=Desulfitispora alkaliphila TaxID=622674 RepID=UPI003D1E4778
MKKIITIATIIIYFFCSVSITEARVQSISRGDSEYRNIALTFDVEGGTDINRVLQTLDSYGVKATFFLLGSWVENNPNLAKQIVDRGHEIGNHTYSHHLLTRHSKDVIIADIKRAEQVIKKATGVNPQPLFRPPYGAVDKRVYNAIGEAGYSQVYLWSIDTRDWSGISSSQITNSVLDNAHNGGIVLMHVNRNNTPEALPGIIEGLQQRKYNIVPVTQVSNPTREEIINYKPITMRVDGRFKVFDRPPILHNGTSYLAARDLAELLGGKISWVDEEKKVVINLSGQTYSFKLQGGENHLLLINRRAYIPLRPVIEQLDDIEIRWDSKNNYINLNTINFLRKNE